MWQKIRENPVVGFGTPLLVVMLIVVLWLIFPRGGESHAKGLVYWYNLEGASLVTAAPDAAAPGPSWVRVLMFVCADAPRDKYPGVLTREVQGREEVSRLDPIDWIAVDAPEAEGVYESLTAACEGSGSVRQWYAVDSEGD